MISGIKVRNDSTADKNEEGWFDWNVFIKAPPDVLDQIDHVVYRLHPTFPDPEQFAYEKEFFRNVLKILIQVIIQTPKQNSLFY